MARLNWFKLATLFLGALLVVWYAFLGMGLLMSFQRLMVSPELAEKIKSAVCYVPVSALIIVFLFGHGPRD